MIRWSDNISTAITMTIGWVAGVLWGTDWYYFPAFTIGVVLVSAAWDTASYLMDRRSRGAV